METLKFVDMLNLVKCLQILKSLFKFTKAGKVVPKIHCTIQEIFQTKEEALISVNRLCAGQQMILNLSNHSSNCVIVLHEFTIIFILNLSKVT